MNPLSDDDLAKWRALTEECERLASAARTAWDHVVATYRQSVAVSINDRVEADDAVNKYRTANALHTAAEQALAAFVNSRPHA